MQGKKGQAKKRSQSSTWVPTMTFVVNGDTAETVAHRNFLK